MKRYTYTRKQILAINRDTLHLIQSLGMLMESLRESARVIGGITDDMARSAAELREALDRI